MTNTVQLNQTEAQILEALLAKAKLNGNKNGMPIVFSIEGSENLVVLQSRSYQKLLDRLEEVETVAAINEGLEDMKAGRGIPAKEFLAELQQEFGTAKAKRKAA